MSRVFDHEEEWEWEKLKKREEKMERNASDIFFAETKQENNNNFPSFEDIIYKNPAFTVQDMERYHYLSEEMD